MCLRSAVAGIVAAGGLLAAGGASAEAAGASSPGVTAKTITIGMINDTTGVASSTFADGAAAAQARVALQNANGGVDGRRLKLVVADSQSSPTNFQTAAQELVQTKGVFGIVSDSSFTFGGASYLTKSGIPVTGDTFDGPEWGTAANMFTYGPPTYTSYNGTSYSYNTISKLLKSVGAKKVAVLAFGISPSATLSAKQLVNTDTKLGLQNCYLNLSVPFGGVDFTADVLQMKAAGCDAAVGTFTAKATRRFLSELAKYDKSYSGGLPDLGQTNSWDATDVMIEGLQLAGPNPTRARFIAKLRKVKNYTLGGVSATPISFNYLTGHLPKTACSNAVQLKGFKFVPVPSSGAPICGTLAAYSGG